eukprot:768806-Hanusia_phi.AAC.3
MRSLGNASGDGTAHGDGGDGDDGDGDGGCGGFPPTPQLHDADRLGGDNLERRSTERLSFHGDNHVDVRRASGRGGGADGIVGRADGDARPRHLDCCDGAILLTGKRFVDLSCTLLARGHRPASDRKVSSRQERPSGCPLAQGEGILSTAKLQRSAIGALAGCCCPWPHMTSARGMSETFPALLGAARSA